MACPASKQWFPVLALEVVKGKEYLMDRATSGNKLSLTKFRCPADGCGKTVDVYFHATDDTAKPRYHYTKGEVAPAGGRGPVGKPVSLATGLENAQSRFHAEMRSMVQRAEREIVSGSTRIAGYQAIIQEGTARIAQIELDLEAAKLILEDPQFAAYRTAEAEPPETVIRSAEGE